MLGIDSLFPSTSFVAKFRALVDMPPSPTGPLKSGGDSNGDSATTTSKPLIMQSPVILGAASTKRRARRPAKNSLYDTMRKNPGVSLFVRPICWTDLHSQLLGARFHKLPPCTTPLPPNVPGSPPSKGHMRPSQTITTLSEALTEILLPGTVHPVLCSNAVRTVLNTLWPQAFTKSQFLPELNLFFGHRVYRDTVRVQIMWNYPTELPGSTPPSFRSVSTRPADSFSTPTPSPNLGSANSTNFPMLCYIGKDQLAAVRRKLFRVAQGPFKVSNEPVQRLQQLRAKLLVPADSDEDAHFVGIFLAMAQKHFYATPPASMQRSSQWSPGNNRPPCPRFRDLKLRLLTHDNETAEFIVYTGYVSAKFLERFHNPNKAPVSEDESGVAGIRIEYTKVPIWPILGLRERLGLALGEDIVGSFDANEIETWEEDAEPVSSGKRQRAALTEVFNGSFEEEPEETTVLNRKRRRLNQGNAVGVVM